MTVGIIGLPQAGATTVFDALTGAHGDAGTARRPGEIQVGVLKVPDERLEFISAIYQPKKTTHATIDVEDCGGVFAHMSRLGETANARAMAQARGQEALLIVLRAFQDPTVPHVLGSVDAARDLARIDEELLLADLGVLENRTETIRKALQR
ncbi:unnamed protein product, partial [marine sediment metagenome]